MDIYCLPILLPWDESDSQLMKLVSPKRRERIQRYVFEADRKLSLYAALLARLSLSIASGYPALELVFGIDVNQKPMLISAPGYHFNVSHSQGFVLCGVSVDAAIGVDVERIGTKPIEMMKQVLHLEEIEYIGNVPALEQNLRFYRIWTRKEAYFKQLGTGLCRNLSAYNTLSEELSATLHTWRHGNYICSVCSHSNQTLVLKSISETDVRIFFSCL